MDRHGVVLVSIQTLMIPFISRIDIDANFPSKCNFLLLSSLTTTTLPTCFRTCRPALAILAPRRKQQEIIRDQRARHSIDAFDRPEKVTANPTSGGFDNFLRIPGPDKDERGPRVGTHFIPLLSTR